MNTEASSTLAIALIFLIQLVNVPTHFFYLEGVSSLKISIPHTNLQKDYILLGTKKHIYYKLRRILSSIKAPLAAFPRYTLIALAPYQSAKYVRQEHTRRIFRFP